VATVQLEMCSEQQHMLETLLKVTGVPSGHCERLKVNLSMCLITLALCYIYIYGNCIRLPFFYIGII
jgi:hypothetical protein